MWRCKNRYKNIKMEKLKYIIVHHTAVSYKKNPDQFNATNKYHKEKWNFKSSLGYYVGYNYEISALGKITQARADGEETAACVGHNKDSIHIALDGNFDIEYPTNDQVRALTNLIREKMAVHSIRIVDIIPHRKFANKSCYGSLLADDWAMHLAKASIQAQIDMLKKKVSDLLSLFANSFKK